MDSWVTLDTESQIQNGAVMCATGEALGKLSTPNS